MSHLLGIALPQYFLLCGDMAKPRAQTHLASPATSSSSPRLPKRTYTRRRRQSPSSSRLTIAPSSALLASLATVAAACSAADGRPLSPDSQPPDFLCPFLPLDVQEEYLVPHTHHIRTDDRIGEDEEDVFYLGPTPTRSKRIARRKRGLVPDKYVQGTDGRWRKEGSWTLYGSTYCDVRMLSLPPVWLTIRLIPRPSVHCRGSSSTDCRARSRRSSRSHNSISCLHTDI